MSLAAGTAAILEPVDLGADAARAVELLALVDPFDHLLEPAQPPVDALPTLDEEVGREREVVDSFSTFAVESPEELLDGAAELGDELLRLVDRLDLGFGLGASTWDGAGSSAVPTSGSTSMCPSGRG